MFIWNGKILILWLKYHTNIGPQTFGYWSIGCWSFKIFVCFLFIATVVFHIFSSNLESSLRVVVGIYRTIFFQGSCPPFLPSYFLAVSRWYILKYKINLLFCSETFWSPGVVFLYLRLLLRKITKQTIFCNFAKWKFQFIRHCLLQIKSRMTWL